MLSDCALLRLRSVITEAATAGFDKELSKIYL